MIDAIMEEWNITPTKVAILYLFRALDKMVDAKIIKGSKQLTPKGCEILLRLDEVGFSPDDDLLFQVTEFWVRKYLNHSSEKYESKELALMIMSFV